MSDYKLFCSKVKDLLKEAFFFSLKVCRRLRNIIPKIFTNLLLKENRPEMAVCFAVRQQALKKPVDLFSSA